MKCKAYFCSQYLIWNWQESLSLFKSKFSIWLYPFFFWLHLFFMKIIFRTSMLLYRFSLFIFTMRIWRSYIYIYFCSGESQDTFTIKRKIIYIFISLYSWSYLKGCMQAAVLLLHNSWVYRYRKLSKLCL